MPGKTTTTPRITKFTNCRLVRGSSLVEQDLWIDSLTGKILKDQEAFYELHLSPDVIIDLGGRILAPGLIDVQLNGAQGFDFSVPCETKEEYDEGLRMVNRGLARTGVTSYLPTVVSSTPEVYWKVCEKRVSGAIVRESSLETDLPNNRSSRLWDPPVRPIIHKMAPSHSVRTSRARSLVPAAMASTNQRFYARPRISRIYCIATAKTT